MVCPALLFTQEVATVASQQPGGTTPQQRAGVLAAIVRDVRLAWRLMGDPRVALAAKVALPALAVLYIVSPVDLIPDIVPVLGQMDDLAVLALAVRLFILFAPPQVVREHRESMGRVATPERPRAEGETVDGDYRIIE